MPTGTPSMGLMSLHFTVVQSQPLCTMMAPNSATRAWISSSNFSRQASGSSEIIDSRPIWPASRTPTATPRAVT